MNDSILDKFLEQIWLGDFPANGHRARARGLSSWENQMDDATIHIGDYSYAPFPHIQKNGYRNMASDMKDSNYKNPVTEKYDRDENGKVVPYDPKNKQQKTIEKAADLMAERILTSGIIKNDDILVPMYNSHGRAGYTLRLANAISEKLKKGGVKIIISDCLSMDLPPGVDSRSTKSSSNNKLNDTNVYLDEIDIDPELYELADMLPNSTIWLLDNTNTRGTTYNNVAFLAKKQGITNRIAPLSLTISNKSKIQYNPDLNLDIVRRRDEYKLESSYILANYKKETRRFVHIPFLVKTKNKNTYHDVDDPGNTSISGEYVIEYNGKNYCLDTVAHNKFGVVAEKGKLDGTLDYCSPDSDKYIDFIEYSPKDFRDPADAIYDYYFEKPKRDEEAKARQAAAEAAAEKRGQKDAERLAAQEARKKEVRKVKRMLIEEILTETPHLRTNYEFFKACKKALYEFLCGPDTVNRIYIDKHTGKKEPITSVMRNFTGGEQNIDKKTSLFYSWLKNDFIDPYYAEEKYKDDLEDKDIVNGNQKVSKIDLINITLKNSNSEPAKILKANDFTFEKYIRSLVAVNSIDFRLKQKCKGHPLKPNVSAFII